MHELSQHESPTAECDEQNFPPPPLQGKQQNDKLFCRQTWTEIFSQ